MDASATTDYPSETSMGTHMEPVEGDFYWDDEDGDNTEEEDDDDNDKDGDDTDAEDGDGTEEDHENGSDKNDNDSDEEDDHGDKDDNDTVEDDWWQRSSWSSCCCWCSGRTTRGGPGATPRGGATLDVEICKPQNGSQATRGLIGPVGIMDKMILILGSVEEINKVTENEGNNKIHAFHGLLEHRT